MMNPVKTTLASGLFIFLFVSDASAYLKFCNKSSQKSVVVAVATRERATGGVVSRGWWTIRRGTCKTPIGGKLSKATSYYYYAHGTTGKTTWTGDYPFCTRTKKFAYRGELRAKPNGSPLKCRTKGAAKKHFKRMRIKSKNFTQNLTSVRSNPKYSKID